jgi:hypothetical protein
MSFSLFDDSVGFHVAKLGEATHVPPRTICDTCEKTEGTFARRRLAGCNLGG